MKVIDYKKFHLSKLVYEKPIKIKGGCLMTKTKYRVNGQDIPIYIQTPKLRTISGLVLNEARSYIDLELDKDHLGFYEFITNVDESNINTTHKNSEEWFGQSLPMDVIDDFYNSPIKMSKIDKATILGTLLVHNASSMYSTKLYHRNRGIWEIKFNSIINQIWQGRNI